MPSHHGVRPDEHERRAPALPRLGQYEPQQPIARAELRTADRAFQRVELLAEREVLEDQFVMSAAGQGQRACHQHDCFEHAPACPARRAKINHHTDRMQFWRGTAADEQAGGAVVARITATFTAAPIDPQTIAAIVAAISPVLAALPPAFVAIPAVLLLGALAAGHE
jgi:hypothetical protein